MALAGGPRNPFTAYALPARAGDKPEKPKPDVTTLAVGEEGAHPKPKPVTTMMVGEETGSRPPVTTLAVGEEGA